MKTSERRRSSLPAPGTIERLKKLLSSSGASRRLVGPEERLVRRQVKALTRVFSVDKLSPTTGSPGDVRAPVRRTQSAEVLTSPTSFNSAFEVGKGTFSTESLSPISVHSDPTSNFGLGPLAEVIRAASPLPAPCSSFSGLPTTFPCPGESMICSGVFGGEEPTPGTLYFKDSTLSDYSTGSGHEETSGIASLASFASLKDTPLAEHQHSPCSAHEATSISAALQHSPHSPAMQSIAASTPTKASLEAEQNDSQRSSQLLIHLDELVGEMALAVGSHPLAHRLSEVHRRLSILSVISAPSRERLPLPMAPRNISSLRAEYASLRKDPELGKAHGLGQICSEIDGTLQGILDRQDPSVISLSDSDCGVGDEKEEEKDRAEQEKPARKDTNDRLFTSPDSEQASSEEKEINSIVSIICRSRLPSTPSLLGHENAAVLPENDPPRERKVLMRDLSHELARHGRSLDAIVSPKHGDLVKPMTFLPQSGTPSPTCAIPPEPTSHLSHPEYNDYGLAYGTDHDEPIPGDKTNVKNKAIKGAGLHRINERIHKNPLLKTIHDNHRVCMRHRSTSLHLTAAELDELLEKYLDCIDLGLGSGVADPKSLFLVPLNDASLPRWIYPGARIKVGRHAPWLQAKSMVISRIHCEVFHDIDCFYVMDVGSTSGTFLNGIRLSETGTKGQPAVLRSGDILQLGIDCESGANELGQVDLRFSAVQLLVLMGYNKKAVARSPHEVEDVTDLKRERPQVGKLLSWKTILRITGKIHSIPRRLEGVNVRMWIEHGDLLHSDAGGMAVIYYKDRPAFTAVYNNYKMNWEVAMTDAAGHGVLLLDLLPGATTVYSLMRGINEVGRLTCVTNDRLVIDPSPGACLGGIPLVEQAPSPFPLAPLNISEVPSADDEPSLVPFYTITVDKVSGRMFFVQRFRTSRRQRLLGEALFFRTKKRLFEPQRRILEARLLLPARHEDQIILGALFTSLLLLEQEEAS